MLNLTKKIVCAFFASAILIIFACKTVKSDDEENLNAKKYKIPAAQEDSSKIHITIPPHAVAEAKEQNPGVTLSNDFSKVNTKIWDNSQNLNDETIYLKSRENQDILSFVTADKNKRILNAKFDFSTGNDYGIIFSTAKDSSKIYNLSGAVMKIRLYIPEELARQKEFCDLSFSAYYRTSNLYKKSFKGELSSFKFEDIGSGWQTVELDFKNKTASLGSKKLNFKLDKDAIENNTFIVLNIKSCENVNAEAEILIDWVEIANAR